MNTTARVTLINPPAVQNIFHQHPCMMPNYLPTGIAYLAAVLEEKGNQVDVIDCNTENINQNQLKQKLAKLNSDIIGITAMTPVMYSALMIARIAKEVCPNTTVVLGGPHATFMDKEILTTEPAVDLIVRGEGEITFAELTKRIINNVGLNTASGITYRHQGQIVQNPNRGYIQNLDDLPFPAYKYFSLEKYRLSGKLFLPVITSRGCPFQCNFCTTHHILGKQYRIRSPQNIGHELELLKREYDANFFVFYDDTLTIDKKRLYDICDEIKSRKLNIPWSCQVCIDQINEDMFIQMKKTNCQQVSFGIESGCQSVLNTANKRTIIEQNEAAINLAKKSGLFVAISIIIGYTGETAQMRKETFDFIRRTEPDDVSLCIATPYPGTELRNEVERLGYKMSSDWSHYDTITPVFENPLLPDKEFLQVRKDFYNNFYSPKYVLRHMFKRNFYSHIVARIAINHLTKRLKGH